MKSVSVSLRRFAAIVCALAATSFVSLPVQAQEIKERNLKFSYGQPKEHPMGVGIQKFADLVAKKSGGKIKITPFPNAVLGGDNQNISGARGGTIDFTTLVTGGLVGVVKDFMLFDFPFLFNSEREAHALADGPVGRKLMDKLPDVGLVGLGIWDLGFRNLTNNRHPVTKIEDIQGLKLRVVQVPIYLDVFKELGANPVPLAFPELYNALEQKAVDGQENPVGLIESNKFYEVQKHLTLTRHTYSGMVVVMSKKTWDTMSDTEKKIIADSAREAGLEERKLSIENNAKAVESLKKHMQVVEPSPAEVQRMRQKVQPVVDKFSKEIGEGFVKEAYSELAKIRGSK